MTLSGHSVEYALQQVSTENQGFRHPATAWPRRCLRGISIWKIQPWLVRITNFAHHPGVDADLEEIR